MTDLISKQAAKEINCLALQYAINFAEEIIEHLPTIGNDFNWIPIEEGPPKNDDWVLITILDEHGDTPYRYTDFGWYLEAAKCWIVDAECRNDIIAWAKMPEPYKKKDKQ